MNANGNVFREDCDWAAQQHDAQWWNPFYARAFPGLKSVTLVKAPSEAQRVGVDKFVTLASGKQLAVEEKCRRSRPPTDIALEFLHVPTGNESPWPGWMERENQFTDYLAYGFVSHRLAFFFPWHSLHAAWLLYGSQWKQRFYVAKAPNPKLNPRYFTHSVCVPVEELIGCVMAAMRIQL